LCPDPTPVQLRCAGERPDRGLAGRYIRSRADADPAECTPFRSPDRALTDGKLRHARAAVSDNLKVNSYCYRAYLQERVPLDLPLSCSSPNSAIAFSLRLYPVQTGHNGHVHACAVSLPSPVEIDIFQSDRRHA
jgi:hypothetical protein